MNPLRSLALFAALAAPALTQAADFAPKDAKGTLAVDFVYESVGTKADKYDAREWRVRRAVHIEVGLTAQAPAEWGSAGPDAAQAEKAAKLQTQTAQLSAQMAPTMAGVQAVMARCGEDEKCIERETAKLGFGMAGSPQVAAAQQAGARAAEAARPGAPRVQQWLGTAQSGHYAFAEKSHRTHADPICMKLPGARCTRDETRQGSGALPPANGSLGAVEVDVGRGQLRLQLPIVPDMLAGTETITTDEPDGTHETATPKGTHPYRMLFMQTADRQPSTAPFNVPFQGGWRSQSGEQRVKFNGQGAEGGTLVMRWRFSAP